MLGGRQGRRGDESGLGLDRHVRLVAVAVLAAALVHVAGLGVDDRDDAVLGDPAHDPPAAIVIELDVLARHEREQPDRRGALGFLDSSQAPRSVQRVTDQRMHEFARAPPRRPRQ